jgi:hypothetical protein
MGRGVLRVQRQRARDWAGEVTEPPPTAPPVNVDVPHVQQAGDTLTCTMGNWNNEPTSYAYAWHTDGTPNSATGATYAPTPEDTGHTVTCVVTATNALGSTTAPPSNGVVVVG